jgi:hypothetical protein
VKTIVPVGTEQVGCSVTLPTGVAGAFGTALTVTVSPDAIQVLSFVLRTRNMYAPEVTLPKVGLF